MNRNHTFSKLRLMLPLLFAMSASLAQSSYGVINAKMKALSPLLGEWQVEAKFISRDGKEVSEKGSHSISWALDSTYFHWDVKLTNQTNGRERHFIAWVTFDTEQSAYRKIYIYGRRSSYVVEFGSYDPAARILTTSATLQLRDSVSEVIRTTLSGIGSDQMEYNNWVKVGDENEFNDYKALFTRLKKQKVD